MSQYHVQQKCFCDEDLKRGKTHCKNSEVVGSNLFLDSLFTPQSFGINQIIKSASKGVTFYLNGALKERNLKRQILLFVVQTCLEMSVRYFFLKFTSVDNKERLHSLSKQVPKTITDVPNVQNPCPTIIPISRELFPIFPPRDISLIIRFGHNPITSRSRHPRILI